MSRLLMWSVLSLVACGPAKLVFEQDSGSVTPEDTPTEEIEQLPGDTSVDSAGADSADTTEPPETWPKECPDLYDPDILPTFELSIDDATWGAFQSDCSSGRQDYHPVMFTYGDESVAAMARLKGNWSWSCDKFQFVISFNEVDSGGRFHGVRKMMLDAPWYDHTLLHERLAFPLFEARGLPYSCVNNAKLYINGEYYGAYANIERIDEEYLERHFEEPDGNLYQGGTELKTNEEIGDTSNLLALQAATTVEEIDLWMDLDQAVAEWATEAMIPAMDNYWAGVEINYYLYDHPSQGFVYLPYDLDISFGDAAYTDGSLVWPSAVSSDPLTYEHYGWQKEWLVEQVLSDEFWCERFVEELVLARAAYVPEDMQAQLATWSAQIADMVEADPRKPYSMASHEASIAALHTFLEERAAYVDAWLASGDHCPARF